MMTNQTETARRNSDRFEHPRMEVEWRVVDGGLYRKSKLINFSNGGLAIVSDRELKPEQKLAFRLRLAGGVSYVMGQVRHACEADNGDSVAGVKLSFADPREAKLYERRVNEFEKPRRNRETCRL